MSRKHKRLGLQKLEDKVLMAGDVAVSVSNGDLHIDEYRSDIGEDQSVQVYQLSNGNVRVQGLNGTMIATDVRLNGQTFTFRRSSLDMAMSDDIFVNLGGGNDSLSMLSHNGGLDADTVQIDMGGGGEDRDSVSVYGLSTRSGLGINTGRDNDHVTVGSSQIGDGSWEDLRVNTGSGADVVQVNTTTIADDLIVQTYGSSSEADNDTLRVDSVVADDLYAYLGNGDDNATVQFSDFDDDVSLDMGYDYASTGQDDDTVNLFFNDVDDDITIRGRDGDDRVYAAFNSADDLDFHGDSGYDQFFSWYSSPGQDSNDIDDLDLHSAFARSYGNV